MNLSLGSKSMSLFGLSIILLLLLTLFDSVLAGLSISVERVIGLLLLVLPASTGVVFGIMGVWRKETKLWMAYLGVLLNGLFALFQLFVISFAG